MEEKKESVCFGVLDFSPISFVFGKTPTPQATSLFPVLSFSCLLSNNCFSLYLVKIKIIQNFRL